MVVSLPAGLLVVAVGWLGTLFLVWSLLCAGSRGTRVSQESRGRYR
ncbi:hypothetical protein [Halorussus salinus]|nr:hypothetical protein [Halorussus salinus]